MRVYSPATASFYTYLILILARTETSVGRVSRSKQQDVDIVAKHFKIHQQKSDKTSLSNSRTVELHCKNAKFVQVLEREVNAIGLNGTDAVILVIETVTFGKVRIRHWQSNNYICMNAKGEIIGLKEKKGKQMKRCVFKHTLQKDGYTEFESDKYGGKKGKQPRYLAFKTNGEPKHYTKVQSDYSQRSIKFMMYDVKPKKRIQKRNIRRRRIKQEFSHHEKHRQDKRVCLRYLRCLHKNWKLKRRGQIKRIIPRCIRDNCRCKCAKQ